MTYDEIKKNKEVCECLKKGNENLGVLGFTDHSAAHCTMVAKRAASIGNNEYMYSLSVRFE